jgi:ABC-type multidrug transport system fused ATPase/permease subunit
MSSALYTAIPLVVSILTFASYIALGNTLDVATALTSLALFDLLRFPLFMLPQVLIILLLLSNGLITRIFTKVLRLSQVLNNVVEAKVSVDRVQGFLLEGEKQPVGAFPLRKTGLLMHKATLVWESAVKRRNAESGANGTGGGKTPPKSMMTQVLSLAFAGLSRLWEIVKEFSIACARRLGLVSDALDATGAASGIGAQGNRLSMVGANATTNPMIPPISNKNANIAPAAPVGPTKEIKPISEDEFLSIVREAQVQDAENIIVELELEIERLRNPDKVVLPLSATSSFKNLTTAFGSRNNSSVKLTSPGTSTGSHDVNMDSSSPGDNDCLCVGGPIGENDVSQPSNTGKDSRVLTLCRVNLHAGVGQLVSIVGSVGSGKSSMLSALLGDLRCCYGTVAVYGSVAFASQVAFIQNSTLKENIIYGLPFDQERYDETLRMCALLPDIKVLPAGHDTEIGERGINLSGGMSNYDRLVIGYGGLS